MFQTIDWRELLMRAAHTFWQGFTAVFVLPDNISDWGLWKSAFVAGIMAGMSAIKGMINEYLALKRLSREANFGS